MTATVGALIATAALLLVPAAASALTNYTWTGEAAPGTPDWSNTTNWGGSAPSGSVGTLTFPALTSPDCTVLPTTATCYASHNDLSGISASGLILDDGYHYFLDGNGITVGSGGITATTSASNGSGNVTLKTPLTLGAPQTWSIDGGTANGQVDIEGDVAGSADALTISLSEYAVLAFLGDDAEVGPVTATGETIDLGAPGRPASLNGTDGNAVSLANRTDLVSGGSGSSVGPLTIGTESVLQVGQPFNEGASGAGTLAVSGGLTLHSFSSNSVYTTSINEPGTTAGESYSQLSATGPVNLGDADLLLIDGETSGPGGISCETLTLGDVDTLITTTGALTGSFAGVPDGTTVPVNCYGSGSSPSAVIHYTAHAVTATIGTGSPPLLPTTTTLGVSNPSPVVGESVTFTATVTPEPGEPAPTGEVLFLDNDEPIATCEAQPLTQGPTSSTATCTVSYGVTGEHRIAALYLGSANYEESFSAEQGLTVQAPPSSGGSGSPAPVPTPAQSPPAPPTGSISFSKTTLTAKPNGQVSVPLDCTGTATCKGTLMLAAKALAKSKQAKESKVTAIGKAAFVIPAGKSATVKVKLNATGRALLKAHHGKLTATLTITKSSPSPASTVHKTVHIVQKGGK